jgi:gamma-glutamylputrescine oxidase
LHALSVEGLEMVREAIENRDPSLQEGQGYLSLARHDDEDGLKRERDHLARHYGQKLHYLSRREVQEKVNSGRYHQGLLDGSAFHVQTLTLCLALADKAEQSGARLYEESPVIAIDSAGTKKRIKTAQARITCRDLVLCCGGYGGAETGRLAQAILPISTYVILTEPLGNRLDQAIATSAALADRRRAGNYFRKVSGSRLLWGGDITAFGLERPAAIGMKLKRDLRSVFPQLGDIAIEVAWGGRMAYARHKMPIVGPLGPGLWACCGFGGHGLNTGPICARLVAEGITGASDRYRLLAPFGLSWNGGVLGPLAAEAIFRSMKLRDAWQERRAG